MFGDALKLFPTAAVKLTYLDKLLLGQAAQDPPPALLTALQVVGHALEQQPREFVTTQSQQVGVAQLPAFVY